MKIDNYNKLSSRTKVWFVMELFSVVEKLQEIVQVYEKEIEEDGECFFLRSRQIETFDLLREIKQWIQDNKVKSE